MRTPLLSAAHRERLAARRRELGLTQVQVAESMDMAPNAFALIERGERPPSYGALARWCAALDLQVELLISQCRSQPDFLVVPERKE